METKAKIKTFITEAIKEFFRLISVSAIPFFISCANLQTGQVNLSWPLIRTLLFVMFLKSVDKGLHKSKIATKGLVRF